VLTRVASSHIASAPFSSSPPAATPTASARSRPRITRHYPQVKDAERPYHALLSGVWRGRRTGRTLAACRLHHGVMNTDNTSVSGETIDYGPCAFLTPITGAGVFLDREARWDVRLCPTSRDLLNGI